MFLNLCKRLCLDANLFRAFFYNFLTGFLWIPEPDHSETLEIARKSIKYWHVSLILIFNVLNLPGPFLRPLTKFPLSTWPDFSLTMQNPWSFSSPSEITSILLGSTITENSSYLLVLFIFHFYNWNIIIEVKRTLKYLFLIVCIDAKVQNLVKVATVWWKYHNVFSIHAHSRYLGNISFLHSTAIW